MKDEHKIYVANCVDIYNHNGLLETLAEEFNKSQIIIPDASLLPFAAMTASKKIPTRIQESFCKVYDIVINILSAQKTALQLKTRDAFRAHVQKDLDALIGTEHAKKVYETCYDFSEKLKRIKSEQLFGTHKEIFEYFLKAVTEIDLQMSLIESDNESRTRIFENLAYASALACTNPQKTHAILSSNIKYVNPFDGMFGIAYSREFAVITDGESKNYVSKNICNPKLSLVFCDLESINQPYITTRDTTTKRTSLPIEWSDLDSTKKSRIKEIIKHYFGRISLILSGARSEPKVEPKSPEAQLNKDAIDRIVIINKSDVQAQSKPAEKLNADTDTNLEKMCDAQTPTIKQKSTPQKFIIAEKELTTLYDGIIINEDQVKIAYSENTLESTLQRYQTIASLARQTNAKNLLDKIEKDTQKIKSYVQTKQQETVKLISSNLTILNKQKQKLETEIANVQESNEKECLKYKNYFEILDHITRINAMNTTHCAVLPGHQINQYSEMQTPESTLQTANKPEIIYKNICHLLGREPTEGEKVQKKILRDSIGITGTGLSAIANRAKISHDVFGHAKTDRTFVFSKNVVQKIGTALKRTKPVLMSEQKTE